MKRKLVRMILLIFLLAANTVFANPAVENEKIFLQPLGDFKLYLLSDGDSQGKMEIIVNASQEDKDKYIPTGKFTSAVNSFLLITPQQKILVDTGYGKEIFANLEKIGLTPEEIDTVLLTHMHGDHIAGLMRDDKVAFPNADIYVAKQEYAYWQDKPSADKLKPYGQRLKFFDPGELEQGGLQLFPGIAAIAAYGHTPGHTMFLIQSHGEKALLWGDITHVTPLQVPMPEIFVTYDVDPVQAVASRQKVLAYLAQNDIIVAGAHIAAPAMGKIIQDTAGGYTFTPQK